MSQNAKIAFNLLPDFNKMTNVTALLFFKCFYYSDCNNNPLRIGKYSGNCAKFHGVSDGNKTDKDIIKLLRLNAKFEGTNVMQPYPTKWLQIDLEITANISGIGLKGIPLYGNYSNFMKSFDIWFANQHTSKNNFDYFIGDYYKENGIVRVSKLFHSLYKMKFL